MAEKSTHAPHDYSGDNVRELRKLAEYSRQKVTALLADHGVSMHQTSLRRIEEGHQPLKIVEALAFCEVFNVSLKELITEPVDPESAAVEAELRHAKKSVGGVFAAHVAVSWRLHNLEKLLSDTSTPPAEQSKTVRDALNWLSDLKESGFLEQNDLAISILRNGGFLDDPDTDSGLSRGRFIKAKLVESFEEDNGQG